MQAFRNTLWVVFSYYKEISINSKRFKLHEYQIKIIFVNTASSCSSKSYLKIGHQSEAVLENNLIKQLRDLSYASVKIQDCEALVANLQSQFSFSTKPTAKEFDAILNHLAKGNVFEKTRRYETVFN
jgi:hypothetical protein